MHVIVDKKANTLLVKEMDGRLCSDLVSLDSRFAKLILKVAYRVPNGTVEYR